MCLSAHGQGNPKEVTDIGFESSSAIDYTQRLNLSIDFLKRMYGNDFDLSNWTIKFKEEKVILKKGGSLTRIELFPAYFRKQIEK